MGPLSILLIFILILEGLRLITYLPYLKAKRKYELAYRLYLENQKPREHVRLKMRHPYDWTLKDAPSNATLGSPVPSSRVDRLPKTVIPMKRRRYDL